MQTTCCRRVLRNYDKCMGLKLPMRYLPASNKNNKTLQDLEGYEGGKTLNDLC